jgi:hypothetical protein
MSLTTPLSVQKLQTALHDKAKGSPNFHFYALYDKVYREDVQAFAYECCKANGGAAGVDGQTFEDIEQYGVKKWLDELMQELKSPIKVNVKRKISPSARCRDYFLGIQPQLLKVHSRSESGLPRT